MALRIPSGRSDGALPARAYASFGEKRKSRPMIRITLVMRRA